MTHMNGTNKTALWQAVVVYIKCQKCVNVSHSLIMCGYTKITSHDESQT